MADSHQRTLYLTNLPPYVTEALLLEKLSAVGPVDSVNICFCRKIQQFTGIVRFRRKEDVSRAVQYLDSNGRPDRTNPAEDGSPEAPVGLLFTGLHRDFGSKALNDTLSAFGVESRVCKALRKGYGYAQLESVEAVNECFAKLDGHLLSGLWASMVRLYTNVRVRNFGKRMNESMLRDMFGHYGAIHDSRIVTQGGRNNGYAYVTFIELKSAAEAIAALDGKDLGGGAKISVVSASQPLETTVESPNMDDAAKSKAKNLYIVVKDAVMSEERLLNLFAPFGTIMSVRVMHGKGKKRAGFVCFKSQKQATRALKAMDGTIVGEAPISVTYAVTKQMQTFEQSVAQAPKDQTSEKLYQEVVALRPTMAGMVTARLLAMGSAQVLQLMKNAAALKSKVDKIVNALLLNGEQHLRQIESAPPSSAAA